jgi:hypothetical protein
MKVISIMRLKFEVTYLGGKYGKKVKPENIILISGKISDKEIYGDAPISVNFMDKKRMVLSSTLT